jgi:hypothetical protein
MKKYAPFLIGFGSVALIAATWALINKNNQQKGEEKPPKKAPQLNIENPGTQSDFTPAASESGLG